MIMSSNRTNIFRFFQENEKWLLLGLFVLGLLIRLAWLDVDFNITADLAILRQWAIKLKTEGLLSFYETVEIRAYPPLSTYLLASVGWVADKLTSSTTPDESLLTSLIKLPSILADLGTAALLVWQARKYSAVWRLLTAVLYLFNPAVWYVSVYWGQIDAIYVFFLLAALMLLARSRVVPAWVCLGLSLGIKLQGAPLLFLFLTWTWIQHGSRQLIRGIFGLLGSAMIIISPWLLSGRLPEMIEAVFPTQTTNMVAQSAYSGWYFFLREKSIMLDAAQKLDFVPISYLAVGVVLFLVVVLFVTTRLIKDRKHSSLPVAAVLISLAAFLFLPEMRERYLFPILPLLLWAAGQRRRLLWLYLILTATWFFNLVTIASFAPDLWTNLVAWQPPYPSRIRLLKDVAWIVSGVHLIIFGRLVCILQKPVRIAEEKDGNK